jgi:N-acetyl sugar amidotransferase
MPDTRPHTLIGENGICQGCKNYDKHQTVDWKKRFKELEELCDKYRRTDGYYDCLVAVSGGKDSHFITYTMKERLGMNPLLITVADPFTKSEAGTHNWNNLSEAFNCDCIVFNISSDLFRRVTKIGFEELGEPLRFVEAAIYTVPFKISVALNIPLVVFGENAGFTYGTTKEDGYSAKKYISAGHSAAAEKLGETITEFWVKRGISIRELNAIIPPAQEDLERVKPEPIFMSYFTGWDDERNYQIAKRYGFKDLHHEWHREGHPEEYSQIDSYAYILNIWLKYPKFGFARTTDIVARWVRKNKISREEGIRLIMKHDHRLDQRALDDFLDFMGYKPKEFWDIVEKFWNKDIFEKVDGTWRLKEPIWKLESPGCYKSLPPHVNLKEK